MKNGIHFNIASSKNKMDTLKKALRIYMILFFDRKDYLKPLEEQAMIYYLLNGYSKETKNLIVKDFKVKITHLNQVNLSLDKKGLLYKDNNKFINKYVNKKLKELKKNIYDLNVEHYLINFKRTNEQ